MNQQMKKIATAFALASLAAISLTSCSKLGRNLQYDLNMQTATVNFTIPACTNTSVALSGNETNYYNIDSFIKANTMGTLGISNITSAKLSSCTITLLDPSSTINFANFKSCTGGFYSDANTTPYQVSVVNNPDVYSSALSLPVDTSAELKGYITNARKFTYTLSGDLRRPTTDSIHCTATFAFKVHVQGI